MRPAPFLARWQSGPVVGGTFDARLVLDDPAWFAGHYPGAPIFPGTFLVEALLQAVLASLEREVRLEEIVACRFYSPLFPGDEVRARVTLNQADDGRTLVQATASGRAKAAEVTLLVASPGTEATDPMTAPPVDLPGPTPRVLDAAFIRTVLPHRPPALLLDGAVIVHGAGAASSLVARKAITTGEPCYAGADPQGRYPSLLVVESFCQACGLVHASAGADREPTANSTDDSRVPVVAKLAALRFAGNAVAGELLEHHVQLVVRTGDGAVFTGHTTVAGRVILRVGRVVAARARLD